MEFSHVKYGVLVAMVAILFGGSLGLSFGCCEDDIKGVLKGSAEKVLSGVYGDDQADAGVEEEQFEELIDIDRVEGRVKASSVKKVGEIVEKHPEEALSIIRSWMYQEG